MPHSLRTAPRPHIYALPPHTPPPPKLMWVTLEATLDLFSDHAEWVKQVVECLEAAY